MGGAGSVVVGVTGHRALPAGDELPAAVDGALDVLADGRAVHLLTSLAEGADRLVAHRVLARDGGTIEALLPLAVDDYERDFTAPASVEEFHALLAVATAAEVVPCASEDREARYEAAGVAVVERSEAVVALWDGQPARGRGGTAEVVGHARRLGRPVTVVEVAR